MLFDFSLGLDVGLQACGLWSSTFPTKYFSPKVQKTLGLWSSFI